VVVTAWVSFEIESVVHRRHFGDERTDGYKISIQKIILALDSSTSSVWIKLDWPEDVETWVKSVLKVSCQWMVRLLVRFY
jgi:hypothetical protein